MPQEDVHVRLDKYLWCIRVFKTRALAKRAIDNGKVRMDGEPSKASKFVNPGDIYEIRTSERRWTIKVLRPLAQRKKYSEAIKYYEDITPAADIELNQAKQSASFYTGKRLSKTGKPSKKERRDYDDFWSDV